MDSKIAFKLIFGYIFIIIIPTVAIEYSYYQQNYAAVKERYIKNEKDAFSISRKNFSIQLMQLEGIYQVFSTNGELKNYMGAISENIAEEVYSYIKSIRPLYNYSINNNPYIQGVMIYEYKKHSSPISKWIVPMDTFLHDQGNIAADPRIFNGFWQIRQNTDETLDFSYYRSIYTSDYTKLLGNMKIQVNLSKIFESFSTSSEPIYFYNDEGLLLQYQNEAITLPHKSIQELTPRNGTVLLLPLEEVNLTAAKIVVFPDAVKYQQQSLVIYVFIFFVFLSVLYFMVTSSITRRILSLNRHIRQSAANSLAPAVLSSYRDEVGDLIHSYNEMIERINQLIHQVYQTELQTKDARYYALQAQIKPHFLYNVLENIRMCAEKNADTETADMIYSLAKFMRYNFSKNKNIVHLLDELEHAKNFLDIYKTKLGDHLQVEIAIYTEIDSVTCPYFILQPLLENSLKHAVIPQKVLHIRITIKDGEAFGRENDVRVDLSDDGMGIEPAALDAIQRSLEEGAYESDNHVGLENVNHRLASYLGKDYSLLVRSSPGEGTTITVYLKKFV
jgi:two-component system sensor histidine kinase YesM